MNNKEINKIAEEKAFDYQRELGMINSVSDDHVIARRMGFYDGFIAGAEWQASRMPMPEDTVLFNKGVEEGKRLMMEEAVEGVVMDFSSNQPRPQVDVYVDPNKYCTGDKVRIVVIKEEEE